MTEQIYKTRIRVNFSATSKNVVSPDVTFEGYDTDKFTCLKEAKELMVLAQAVARELSTV